MAKMNDLRVILRAEEKEVLARALALENGNVQAESANRGEALRSWVISPWCCARGRRF